MESANEQGTREQVRPLWEHMSVSARLHSVGTLFEKEPKEDGDAENKNNEGDEPAVFLCPYSCNYNCHARLPENPEP